MLLVLPALLALSGGLVALAAPGSASAAPDRDAHVVVLPHLVAD